MMASAAGRIGSIQILRGFAAVSVLVFHVFENLKPYDGVAAINHETRRLHVLGLTGVDLFFAISGFIMMLVITRAGEGRSRQLFLSKRLIRIVPIYWLLTGAVLLAHLARYVHDGRALPSGGYILSSFLFVPARNAEGAVGPLLEPGWTLSFEMFFYLLLTAVIPRRPPQLLRVMAVALLGLAGAGLLVHPGDAVLQTVTSPLLLEFLAGMLIFAYLDRRPGPSAAGALLAFAASFVLLIATWDARITGEWQRVLIRGVPAALILLGTLRLPQSARVWRWGPLLLLGDASYSLYLTHEIVLSALLRTRLYFGALSLWVLVPIVLAVAVAVALGFHRWVEQPLLRRLSRWAASNGPARLGSLPGPATRRNDSAALPVWKPSRSIENGRAARVN